MKLIIDLSLDGYDTDEEEEAAIIEFIEDQLDFSGSSIKILGKVVELKG